MHVVFAVFALATEGVAFEADSSSKDLLRQLRLQSRSSLIWETHMNENYAGTRSSRQKRARLNGPNWRPIARCGQVSTFGITDLPFRPEVLGTAQNRSLSQFGADRLS